MSYTFTGTWVHDLDKWLTEDPRDAIKPVHICKHECEIYEGDTYYEIDGVIYCENCVKEGEKVAEIEDPDYPED